FTIPGAKGCLIPVAISQRAGSETGHGIQSKTLTTLKSSEACRPAISSTISLRTGSIQYRVCLKARNWLGMFWAAGRLPAYSQPEREYQSSQVSLRPEAGLT